MHYKSCLSLIFLTSLFIVIPLFAQDTTKPFSFPHKTGDMWEYGFSETGISISEYDTIQVFTIFDSTDSKGMIYIKQYSRFIDPIRDTVTFDYWIDTSSNYVYGLGINGRDSTIIYKLNAQKGEKWFDTTIHQGAEVMDKWNGSIFGKATTFMNIRYFLYGDTNDTNSWYFICENTIADGLGLIQFIGYESSGEKNILGGVINGIYYGDTTLVSVKQKNNVLPLNMKLYQNYPNPFNPSTTINFEIAQRSNVSLVVFDILGKEIMRLIDDQILNAGTHQRVWNGSQQNGNRAASGIYFYQLKTPNEIQQRKMLLLK